MDKPQQDKTKWKEVISQSDSAITNKEKADPDAPILNKNNYTNLISATVQSPNTHTELSLQHKHPP